MNESRPPTRRIYRQVFSEATQRWSKREAVIIELKSEPLCMSCQRLSLPLGGEILIYPDWLANHHLHSPAEAIVRELESAPYHFRQQTIQGLDEPRAHSLFHDRATANPDEPQPGYRYGKITLKARPVGDLPFLEQLTRTTQSFCHVECWRIGINPVFYRDAKDYMGFHADDDQGETLIFTVILHTQASRAVIVQPRYKPFQDGMERYEFCPETGDAYQMDGEMQKHYVHRVERGTKEENNGICQSRWVVVFRDGILRYFQNETGRSLERLQPRENRVLPSAGNAIPGLNEGEIYTRPELLALNAHVACQRGVSGSIDRGCEAIIVSGRPYDGLGRDRFDSLEYAVENCKGGCSLLASLKRRLPVRVFRSSNAASVYRAAPTKGPARYRYDGIYEITRVWYTLNGDYVEEHASSDEVSDPVVERLYHFELFRIPVGNDLINHNRVSTNEMLKRIEREAVPARTQRKRSRAMSQTDQRDWDSLMVAASAMLQFEQQVVESDATTCTAPHVTSGSRRTSSTPDLISLSPSYEYPSDESGGEPYTICAEQGTTLDTPVIASSIDQIPSLISESSNEPAQTDVSLQLQNLVRSTRVVTPSSDTSTNRIDPCTESMLRNPANERHVKPITAPMVNDSPPLDVNLITRIRQWGEYRHANVNRVGEIYLYRSLFKKNRRQALAS